MLLLALLIEYASAECTVTSGEMVCTYNEENNNINDNLCDDSINSVIIVMGDENNPYGKIDIEKTTFSKCTNLKSLTIKTLAKVVFSEDALKGTKLENINIICECDDCIAPDVDFGESCFADIKSQLDIKFQNINIISQTSLDAFIGSNVHSIVIESVSSISVPKSLFENSESLETVNIQCNGPIYIHSNAFKSASNLKTLNLKATNNIDLINSSFESCTSLTEVAIESEINTTLEESAFFECNHLASAKISGSYIFIKANSLACTALTDESTKINPVKESFKDDCYLGCDVQCKDDKSESMSESSAEIPDPGKKKLSKEAIIGIVVGCIVFVAIVVTVIVVVVYKKKKLVSSKSSGQL